MQLALAVAAGGAVGALLRWLIASNLNNPGLPIGTWTVNVIGSFIIGVLLVYLASRNVSNVVETGLMTGVLGGFTTFSAFSLEVVQLIERGQLKTALIYLFASVSVCILAAFAGMSLARNL